jgi:hypothetical protein
MKKLLIITLVAVIATSCSVLSSAQNPASNIDTQATIDAMVRISEEQTQAAQPSPTTVPPTEAATQVVASSPTTDATLEATADVPTSTSISNLTTTPSTATSGPTLANVTAIATQAGSLPGTPTLTPTLGILTYGTLPPAVPSAPITILNKSKTQAYISLQNDPPQQVAILEYPVKNKVNVRAPLGYYTYVVWVGGRQIVGEFKLHKGDDLTITIYKDRVEIKQ